MQEETDWGGPAACAGMFAVVTLLLVASAWGDHSWWGGWAAWVLASWSATVVWTYTSRARERYRAAHAEPETGQPQDDDG